MMPRNTKRLQERPPRRVPWFNRTGAALTLCFLPSPGPSSKSVYKLQERELPPSAVCAEFQVQAGLHHIDIRSDVDWKCRDGPDRTREPAGEANSIIVTEAVVIVFDEPREQVKERIFTANTNGPPAAGLADREHRACSLQAKIGSQPGTTALDIEQEPIPGLSISARDRGE